MNPKWDGFRALVFRDGDDILLQSRDQKSLNRYFPELVETLLTRLPERCVLDGEIVIATERGLNFDLLQLRIHPATSRVKLLSQQTPASVVFFDLLCEADRNLCGEPFQERRKQLERMLASSSPPIHITPATHEASVASDWFRRFEGAGLDGVIAKQMNGTYEPDKRVMLKIKHERDCDCVVAGFRWHKTGEGNVGSLLLGLFDDSGSLQHVRVCASFTQAKRGESGGIPPALPARSPWSTIRGAAGRSLEPMGSACRAVKVAGARAKTFPGSRYGLSWLWKLHTSTCRAAVSGTSAQFRRWRTDKQPSDCTYAQLEVVRHRSWPKFSPSAANFHYALSKTYPRKVRGTADPSASPDFPSRVAASVNCMWFSLGRTT